MFSPKISTAAAILAFSVSAQATIVFNIQVDRFNTAAGTAAPSASLLLFVASTLDGSFGQVGFNANTAPGSFLSGDDVVLFKTNALGYGVPGVADFTTGPLALSGNWNLGDPLAILWFPTLTTANTFIPAGTSYGLYTRATAVDGTQAWITPSDPTSSYSLAMYTTNGGDFSPGVGAANPPSAGNASLTSTPEPTSAALLTLGLVSLASRRRRQVK